MINITPYRHHFVSQKAHQCATEMDLYQGTVEGGAVKASHHGNSQKIKTVGCVLLQHLIVDTMYLLPCLLFDGLRCGWIRWMKEEGRSCLQVVVGGVQNHLNPEGGVYPSFCLARSGEKAKGILNSVYISSTGF